MSFNLEPLQTFFAENLSPEAFEKLLDQFLYDYMTMLVRIQLSAEIDKTIHDRTEEFIFYINTLRDVLLYCEKE